MRLRSLLTVTLLTVIAIFPPGALSEPVSDCEADLVRPLEQPKIIPGNQSWHNHSTLLTNMIFTIISWGETLQTRSWLVVKTGHASTGEYS